MTTPDPCFEPPPQPPYRLPEVLWMCDPFGPPDPTYDPLDVRLSFSAAIWPASAGPLCQPPRFDRPTTPW